VSQQFELKPEWEERLKAPIFQKIRMGEYFVELDKKFSNEFRGSAVDVDIFANNVKSDSQAEHMEELLFKLRRTPHTVHAPQSMNHAAIRSMLEYGDIKNLVKMLDDRMNYGVFLDEYSSILALDRLLEKGEVRAAARIASQLMLQEELDPLPSALGNLACWRYIEGGKDDPWFYPDEIEVDPNPDEVIRVRVRVVPNNYHDGHFDLRDPDKILGKTLIHFNLDGEDVVSRSLLLLGHHLHGDADRVLQLLKESKEVCGPVLEALKGSEAEEVKESVETAVASDLDIHTELIRRCVDLDKAESSKLIQQQKEQYKLWNEEREDELRRQYEKLQRAARIEAITQTKLEMEKEEQKLFFFDDWDRYEMEKEEKVQAWRRTLPKTNWNMQNYPQSKYYKKTTTADGERKLARWEVVQKKKGPPK